MRGLITRTRARLLFLHRYGEISPHASLPKHGAVIAQVGSLYCGHIVFINVLCVLGQWGADWPSLSLFVPFVITGEWNISEVLFSKFRTPVRMGTVLKHLAMIRNREASPCTKPICNKCFNIKQACYFACKVFFSSFGATAPILALAYLHETFRFTSV
jgi:hypothetical protein